MIVLTLEPGEAEKLAEGARRCSAATACRSTRALPPAGLLGARLPRRRRRRPARPRPRRTPLLRRLRVRTMLGGLLDDPALLAAAASDAAWTRPSSRRGARATRSTPRCRRTSTPRARRRPRRGRSITSSAVRRSSAATPRRAMRSGALRRRSTVAMPGFNPVEAYEAAIANLAPELGRGQARVRRRDARVGGAAAGHGRGRSDRPTRRHAGPRRARAASPADSRPAPTSTGPEKSKSRPGERAAPA